MWVAGLVGMGSAVLGLLWFVSNYPQLALVVGCLLVIATGGGLYLRYRMLEKERMRFLAANSELAKIDRMTGDQFEHLIAQRMIADGFRQVDKRGRAGDGGVDITAVVPGHGRFAVQCKRYRRSVGAPEVRDFLGALANGFAGHTGILVTSGSLTRQARVEALGARQPLVLVERDRLAEWMLGRVTLSPAGSRGRGEVTRGGPGFTPSVE